MAREITPIRKGQLWQKKVTLSPTPYYALVIGKARGARVKTVCSDGNTHSILPFILHQKFTLVEERK